MAGSSASGMPGVDVEHLGAGLDLGQDVALDAAEVAGLHLLGQGLAPGRVDALADDHERPVEADDDLARRGAEEGVGHVGEVSAVVAGGSAGPPATPPDWISSARWCLVYSASRRSDSALTTASRSSPHGSMRLAPLPDVGVVLAHPGAVGGLVDGDLEARMEDDLARAPGVLGHDLGGDVAPPDDREHGRHVRRLLLRIGWRRRRLDGSAAATSDVARSPKPVRRTSNVRPSRRRAATSRRDQRRVVGLGEVDEPGVVAEVDRQQLGMAVEAEAR